MPCCARGEGNGARAKRVMRRDFTAYVRDVHRAAESIQYFILGIDRETFLALEEKQAAVERKLGVIGEAILQCRMHYPEHVAELGDVQGVVGFRNYLAHRYAGVAADVVWDVVMNDVPPLLAHVKGLLGVDFADDEAAGGRGGASPPVRRRYTWRGCEQTLQPVLLPTRSVRSRRRTLPESSTRFACCFRI